MWGLGLRVSGVWSRFRGLGVHSSTVGLGVRFACWEGSGLRIAMKV